MPLAWTEVVVRVPAGWSELVAGVLHFGPCTTVAFGAPSLACEPLPEGFECVRTFVSEVDDSPELRARIEDELASLAERCGAPELAELVPRFKRLPPEDYATSWRRSWKPLRAGGFAIVPPDDRRLLRPGDLRLALEPLSAFGTGRHATTRLVLRGLRARVRRGQRIVDAGTGSGILAVAAALAGASRVLGFDVDPVAVREARDLAELNGVAGTCSFVEGGFEVLGGREREFDGAVANLYSDLIEARALDLARALVPGGWFVISGCNIARRERTTSALESAGLALTELATRGRWDAYTGLRSDRGPAQGM